MLMIFVDEIGEAFPFLNHSPWNNITLADFVMPWFLFMVGVSLVLSSKKFKPTFCSAEEFAAAQKQGTWAILVRSAKLFGLGVLIQGGGFLFGRPQGWNLASMRWCGILNRIGFAYLVAGLVELWVPAQQPWPSRPVWSSVWAHRLKWGVVFAFLAFHLVLTLFTYVPSWQSEYAYEAKAGGSVRLKQSFTIDCNVRGAISTPQCSATSYYDRVLFGQAHLRPWMSHRLPECSSCSPGSPSSVYRPDCHYYLDRMNASAAHPRWCSASMYDPEGALATIPSVMSVWLGTHFSRTLFLRPSALLLHWSAVSAVLVAAAPY